MSNKKNVPYYQIATTSYITNLDEIKISIHALTPDALESRGVLTKAKKGYVCPLCGNGEGKDGTGIDFHEKNGAYVGKCFKCGAGFDNFKLLGLHYRLDTANANDFVEICKRACEDFNIPADFGTPSYDNPHKVERVMQKFEASATANPVQPPHPQISEDAPPDPAELKLIHADIAQAHSQIANMPAAMRRGLSVEVLEYFGCGFIYNWTHPKSRLKGYFETPTPRMIIRYDKYIHS